MTTTSNPTTFTVMIHPTLVGQLDECFSPSDGIQAIDDPYLNLPKVHRSREGKRPRLPRRSLKVYRGRYAWFDLGFSYVQIGSELHVLELWIDEEWSNPNRTEVDSVIGSHNADP